MLDAAADYPFVNQTTLIEYYLINLSYLTLAGIEKKAKKKNESQKESEFDLVVRNDVINRTIDPQRSSVLKNTK